MRGRKTTLFPPEYSKLSIWLRKWLFASGKHRSYITQQGKILDLARSSLTCPAAPSLLLPSDPGTLLCSSPRYDQSRTCRSQRGQSHSLPSSLKKEEPRMTPRALCKRSAQLQCPCGSVCYSKKPLCPLLVANSITSGRYPTHSEVVFGRPA